MRSKRMSGERSGKVGRDLATVVGPMLQLIR